MFKTLISQVKQYKKDSILCPIFVVLEVIMEVLIPFLMASIIDNGVESGNIEYVMFFPMDSDDDICILEKWESKENIEAHQKTLHYAILNELKEKYVEKVEIKKYWVEELM